MPESVGDIVQDLTHGRPFVFVVLPRPVRTWTWTTLREKPIKIGTKVVRHAKAVTLRLAEVAVPRALFAAILGRIGRLRATPSPG
jgi:hypothetical protein